MVLIGVLKLILIGTFDILVKTLEIKAWGDRRPKIDLNFRAVVLQGAVAGAFEFYV